jgi:3,4-dihydroxy 2-butanone 4-phosphate synthase/GTP cyclohydrolase II
LQEHGHDTVQANEALGFKPDLRDYGVGAQILCDLGLTSVRIITNNPRKIVGLEGYGLQVTKRESMPPSCNSHNLSYLFTKKEKLGHWLELGAKGGPAISNENGNENNADSVRSEENVTG